MITILTCILLLSITVRLGYVLYFFGHIFRLPKSEAPVPTPAKFVSVIICARNEAENLRKNLPEILAQRYANETGKYMYEVIVVNDASEDETEVLLSELSAQHAHLRIVSVDKHETRTLPGKKFALGKGVNEAKGELLLFTDADCRPASREWLQKMVAALNTGKEIAVGVGKYETKPGLLNAFVQWETMHSFLQYGTYLMAGKPYMAVGRNLACTKSAYQLAASSDAWNKLPSGDDDLLMAAAATSSNTALVTGAQAFTLSPAKDNWQDWIRQKQRHLSTGKYYRPGIKAWLSVYASAHAAAWVCFLILLFTPTWSVALGAMFCQCMVYWYLWVYTYGVMKEKVSWFLLSLFDLGWMVYNFAFSPYIIFKNKQLWK